MRKRRNRIPLLYGPSKRTSKIVYPAVHRHVLEFAYSPNGNQVRAFQNRIPLMYSEVNIGSHFKFSQVAIFLNGPVFQDFCLQYWKEVSWFDDEKLTRCTTVVVTF